MWLRTKAGKNMPVDPKMISYRRPEAGRKAAEKIVTQAGEVICADRVDNSRAEGVGYISHFATCHGAGRNGKKHNYREDSSWKVGKANG